MEYLIFRLKKDKRYKQGYRPNTFEYVDEAESYNEAREKVKSHKENGYIVGINTITRY